MVGSASVDDRRGGQSDHSGKTALNFLKFTDLSIPMHSNPSQAMFSDGRATSCAASFEQLGQLVYF